MFSLHTEKRKKEKVFCDYNLKLPNQFMSKDSL